MTLIKLITATAPNVAEPSPINPLAKKEDIKDIHTFDAFIATEEESRIGYKMGIEVGDGDKWDILYRTAEVRHQVA